MSTKHKTEIRQHDDTLTTIITKASNVLYKDGTTAQDKLDDRNDSMFTQKIENSSSMFKVGQGDTVDFSENVASGAFESCTLHGRTLVNYNQEGYNRNEYVVPPSGSGQNFTLNDTIEGHVKSAILKGMTLVNLVPKFKDSRWTRGGSGGASLEITDDYFQTTITNTGSFVFDLKDMSIFKPNKVYTFIIDVLESSFSSVHLYNLSWGSPKLEVGINKFTLTPEKENPYIRLGQTGNLEVGSTLKIANIVVVEGDYTNLDIPYFEGMQSVKMPVLTTTGKNLFNPNAEFNMTDGTYGFIKLTNNKNNSISVVEKDSTVDMSDIYFGLTANGVNASEGYTWLHDNGSLDTAEITNSPYGYFSFHPNNKTTLNKILQRYDIQFEKSVTTTTYEPYKSNILTCNEEVELRGFDSMEDTLNLNTGEYVKRIGELTLNGSEGWQSANNTDGTMRFNLPISDFKDYGTQSNGKNLINNKLPKVTFSPSGNRYGVSTWCNHVIFYTEHTSVNDFKQWLSQNPTTVQYELSTESIKTVVLSDNVVYSYDEVTHYDCSSVEGSLIPTLEIKDEISYKAIIKPSTKYSVVFNVTKIGESLRINLGGLEVGVTSTIGKNIVTITTPSTLSHEYVKFIGTGNKVKDVQVIEGDVVGDEPYFEGMIDCKSPILSNVGKNLFDEQRHSNPDNFFVHSSYWSIPIRLKGNTEYRFSYTFNNVLDKQVVMRFATCKWKTSAHSVYPYSLGQVFNKNITSNLMGKTESMSFVTPADGLVYLHYYNTELTNSPSSFNLASWYTHILKDIQLEESSTSTQCEQYKSNTTIFNQKDGKTIVLRSLPNGVCDTLNIETGEYVQRIGEVVLDGSELWSQGGTQSSGFVRFYAPPADKKHTVANVMSSDIAPYNGITPYGVVGYENVTGYSHNIHLNINVKMERIGATNIAETKQNISLFQQWLSQNPITVQYELETPIIKIVDIQGFPYAYEDGHVQLSSAHNGSSLTPKIEYSVVTNRNGQIRSNQRMVERHEKKLNQLQEMILVNVIDTQYRQTLTSLNYELTKVGENYGL